MSPKTAHVQVLAPLTGVMVPIESVPDPVFAQKMVGDGFSIDPFDGTVFAPVSGEIADLQNAHHALTIRTPEGIEILIHIGLETVGLEGRGFTPHVARGDKVDAGDKLITFDVDRVAREAKSLLTQVVVANMDAIGSIRPETGMVVGGRSLAATIEPAAPKARASAGGGGEAFTGTVAIPNPTGLHARPAATLVALAKGFESDIKLASQGNTANAKSIVAIMGLGLAHGQEVEVSAVGPDAERALTEVIEAISGGLGEEPVPAGSPGSAQAAPEQAAPAQEPPARRSEDPDLYLGIPASPGLAVGALVQLRTQEFTIVEAGLNPADERRTLRDGLNRALWSLGELADGLRKQGDEERAAIFSAHEELLQDPELLHLANVAVNEGKSAAFAWRNAYTTFADQLESLGNEVLAGRATDVRDAGVRVLQEITGQKLERPELPENTILVAEELTPSDTAHLDRSKVVGFATVTGGASSHVAIIARSLDIPAIAGIENAVLDLEDGTRAVLDGTSGELRTNLSEADLSAVRKRQKRIEARKAAEYAKKDEPAVTSDGRRVQVVANIGGVDDAKESQTKGAEGVGLLRSEFVFLGRADAPSEEEQVAIYADCARALAPGQPLVIRTLDVGGDKPLAYLPLGEEDNPFLGLRGVRVGLDRPETLRPQIRAILRTADEGAKLHVMFPMVATISDWRRAKAMWDEEAEDLGYRGKVSLGIMMEVPSVGVMAKQFAAEEGLDFFSVGSNDLTSYTLAMDRGNAKVAAQVDACDPSILALIGQAAEALHEKGKWIGVCGGVASDPQAVPILVGLGVDELSCSIPAIPSIKAKVRAYSYSECKSLADAALTSATPEEVRALVPLDEV